MAPWPRLFAAALLASIASVALGAASALAANPCQIAKLRAAGQEAHELLVCERIGAAKGASPSCIAAAQQRRAVAFGRAESRGGCLTSDDSVSLGNEAANLASAVLELLRPGAPTASRCTGGQLAAMGRAARKLMNAYARDARLPDPDHLAAALDAVRRDFEREYALAVNRGGCLTEVSGVDAYGHVTYLVGRILGQLFPFCGDDIWAPGEACDGTNNVACPFGCAADCTCAPPTCPCWESSAELDVRFPPGFFDRNDLGGGMCLFDEEYTIVGSSDTCTINGPAGMSFTFPRAGVLIGGSVCIGLFADLDPDDNGSCNGAPDLQSGLAPEEVAVCESLLAASKVERRECK